MELLQTIDECIESALKAAKQEGRDSRVVAVGITNQRETSLAWDKNTGQPLHKAIVWFDNRTASLCHKIGKELGSAVSQRLQHTWPPQRTTYLLHMSCS